MRKPKLGTVKNVVQRHRASEWQIQNWNPGALRSNPVPFPKYMFLAHIVNWVTVFYAFSTSVVKTMHHTGKLCGGKSSFLYYLLISKCTRMK